MLASASAAALATLAVTVAVPALADDPAGAKGPDDLAACLRDNGLADAPDGDDLKPWLGPRLERDDAAARRALEKCAPPKPTIIQRQGPSEKDLRSCLTEHGIKVPAGDGRALKGWFLEHGDDAANRDALKACDIVLPGKSGDDGPCGGKERGVLEVVRGGRAGKAMRVEPGRAGEPETAAGAN
jgi:hypothetical protein